ncbi:MAG: septation protein A [Methylophilales bacterium]|jgi:intracellular septation protein|nr:septation protein A [Pseudomonadota bacterium]NQW35156.1 septation protein A [Methylophilales bacterium]HCK04676.1 septation protein A [Methylophilaceae bacterium]|tara:strand:- start:18838 stop:19365 length:528 start_codon:yes stop_codon:yes gene_type:complete
MKFLYDLLPVILFFISYKFYGIYTATAVAIATTLLQIMIALITKKTVDKMLIFNGFIITFLGGLTILFQDKTFIMWKPSVIYWLLSAVLVISALLFNKNLLKKSLGTQIKLNDKNWSRLNIVTAVFFVLLGFINLYVAFNYDENTWVNFKLFGITGILFIYMIFVTIFVSKVSKE